MAQRYHNVVCTVNALTRTIENDRKVSRWFLYLIMQPQVKARGMERENGVRLYKDLKTASVFQIIFDGIFLCLIVLICLSMDIYILLAALPVTYFYMISQLRVRKIVAQISMVLVLQDFKNGSLEKNTLYQIGEYYAQKYNINALVEALISVKTILRNTFFSAYIFVTFIYPQDTVGQFISVIILIVYVMYNVVNMPSVYKHLR